jgi:hypothetical protein
MTHNRSLLFAVAAAASLMISAPAFAQGAAFKLHEGRSSAANTIPLLSIG